MNLDFIFNILNQWIAILFFFFIIIFIWMLNIEFDYFESIYFVYKYYF